MLTPAQQATLKAYIQNDATLNAKPNNNTGNGEIANALNTVASPDYYVWITSYTPELKAAAIDASITQVDNLTASKRDTLPAAQEELFQLAAGVKYEAELEKRK